MMTGSMKPQQPQTDWIWRGLYEDGQYPCCQKSVRGDFESKKRRMACRIHETVRVFLSRSLAGHERVQ